VESHRSRWEAFVARHAPLPLSYHPSWPSVFADGLGHAPFVLEAEEAGKIQGLLPLALLQGPLFGRFLVSHPYLNYGGPLADSDEVALGLIARAVELADRLSVRRLLLRHEREIDHPLLRPYPALKVNVRRSLQPNAEDLWNGLESGVRNQVRKGRKNGLTVSWGSEELLDEFYDVFSRNMRDLGTPVYGRRLFRSIVRRFPDQAEFCVVRAGSETAAAALLLHGWGVTEVPSASSLRRFNPTCANMLMYWNLLERAVDRGQEAFDFGRCTPEGPVFKFKEQWGGRPEPARWQSYERYGEISNIQHDDPGRRNLVQLWKRLPVSLTRLIGPPIVRGVP
jgi:FemAB-related protein (PEP-CTERM system-associated)